MTDRQPEQARRVSKQTIASDPRLPSLLLPMDDEYADGFAISVVKQQ